MGSSISRLLRPVLVASGVAVAFASYTWRNRSQRESDLEHVNERPIAIEAHDTASDNRHRSSYAGVYRPVLSSEPDKQVEQSSDTTTTDHSQMQTATQLHWYNLMHGVLEDLRRCSGSVQEEEKLFVRLSKLCSDFTEQAAVYTRLIVSELGVPDHLKSIKPVSKGIAGGQKFFVGGILLKVSRDTEPTPGRFVYGGDVPNDELAGKAASNDLRGANAAFALTHSDLKSSDDIVTHVPLQCLIDYRGFRVVAMPILPISDETLHYGADNAGSDCTVKALHPCVAVMERLGEKLHLAKHTVTSSSQVQEIVTAVDVECHCVPITEDQQEHKNAEQTSEDVATGGTSAGGRKRALLVDLARLCPPEAPVPDVLDQAPLQGTQHWLHQLLRPEYLLWCKDHSDIPKLSPDAFSPFSRNTDGKREEHEAALLRATQTLYGKVINDAVKSKGLLRSGNISRYLHQRGICVRHLGSIRQRVSDPAVSMSLLSEMVSRVLKNQLREAMRSLTDAWSGYRKGIVGGTAAAQHVARGHKSVLSLTDEWTVLRTDSSSGNPVGTANSSATVPAAAAAAAAAAAKSTAEPSDSLPARSLSSPIVRDRETRVLVCNILNLFLGSREYWCDVIVTDLRRRFGKGAVPMSVDDQDFCNTTTQHKFTSLPSTLAKVMWDERSAVLRKHGMRMIRNTCKACGIVLTELCEIELDHSATRGILQQFQFAHADVSFEPRVKYMACVDYFHGRALLGVAGRLKTGDADLRLKARLAAAANKSLQNYKSRCVARIKSWKANDHAVKASRWQIGTEQLRNREQVRDTSTYRRKTGLPAPEASVPTHPRNASLAGLAQLKGKALSAMAVGVGLGLRRDSLDSPAPSPYSPSPSDDRLKMFPHSRVASGPDPRLLPLAFQRVPSREEDILSQHDPATSHTDTAAQHGHQNNRDDMWQTDEMNEKFDGLFRVVTGSERPAGIETDTDNMSTLDTAVQLIQALQDENQSLRAAHTHVVSRLSSDTRAGVPAHFLSVPRPYVPGSFCVSSEAQRTGPELLGAMQ